MIMRKHFIVTYGVSLVHVAVERNRISSSETVLHFSWISVRINFKCLSNCTRRVTRDDQKERSNMERGGKVGKG
jgi:hypothetical protein